MCTVKVLAHSTFLPSPPPSPHTHPFPFCRRAWDGRNEKWEGWKVREWFQGGVIGGEGVRGRWEREEGVEERVRCGVVEDMRGEQTGSEKMQFSQMSTTSWYEEWNVACWLDHFKTILLHRLVRTLITHPSDNNSGHDHFSACHLLILCLLLQVQTKEILIWEKLIKFGINLQPTIMLPSYLIHSQQYNSCLL